MKTVLICHHDALLDYEGLARWLASFTELAGIIVLHETRQQVWRRVKREWQRSGPLRFCDVLAFRLYYSLFLAGRDDRWEQAQIEQVRRQCPEIPATTRILHTSSPNGSDCEKFLSALKPDIILARCKFILKEKIFGQAKVGTFVMHPGVCPEYRNAHGCFWALARRDLEKVGMTLLKIDKGVDTGPVYGYYTYRFDEARESHAVIQARVVFDNLDVLRQKFEEIYRGEATTLDTKGRESGAWGQPWLTQYWRWKRLARRRQSESNLAALP